MQDELREPTGDTRLSGRFRKSKWAAFSSLPALLSKKEGITVVSNGVLRKYSKLSIIEGYSQTRVHSIDTPMHCNNQTEIFTDVDLGLTLVESLVSQKAVY